MLIQDEVLRADFQPSEIVHRHDELEVLSNALAGAAADPPDRSTGAFIYGPSGTGKTTAARVVLDQLAETADVDTVHVDCWRHHSSVQVYYAVLDAIHDAYAKSPEGQTATALLAALEDALTRPVVVVLDEADQLQDEQALYEAYEISEIVPVLIANRRREWLSGLDMRVTSRIDGYPSVRFGVYSDAELVGILEARMRAAAGPEVVAQAALEAVAAEASGDARTAIAILRHVVEQYGPTFDAEDVPAVLDDATEAVRRRALGKLTQRQDLIYQALVDADSPLGMGALHQAVCDRLSEDVSKRTLRKDLAKLREYDVVAKDGDRRGATYCALV